MDHIFKPDKTENLISVLDYEKAAEKVMDKIYFEYTRTGADSEKTLAANRNAFDQVKLQPRAFTNINLFEGYGTRILGHDVASPIGLGPVGIQGIAHPDGELATSKAAAKLNQVQVLSIGSNYDLEEIAQGS